MRDQYAADLCSRGKVEKEYPGFRWASESDEGVSSAYHALVDVFGKNLNSRKKDALVKTMLANSGFANSEKTACTLSHQISNPGGKVFFTAACVYSEKPRRDFFYHEGVHFFANYGFPRDRVVRKDVPLANSVGFFINFMDDIEGADECLELLGPKHRFLEDGLNPFFFEYVEHEDAERLEASMCALRALSVARKSGERAGLEYIAKLAREANVA